MFLLNHDKRWFYLVNIIHKHVSWVNVVRMYGNIVQDIWSRRFCCSSVLCCLVHLSILIHSRKRKCRYELCFLTFSCNL